MANNLRAALTDSATSILLNAVSEFPSSGGIVQIENELIAYTSSSVHQLSGCTRGAFGTAAAAHLVSKAVTAVSRQSVSSLAFSALTDPASLAATDVDAVEALVVTLTGAHSATLPTPSFPTLVRRLHIANATASTNDYTVNAVAVVAGATKSFLWTGAEWIAL